MDYKRQYDLLIEKARQRGKVEGYKERHHIIPRCMGGSNKKENIVELTAREHYVAHRLLYMHHRTPQMAHAFNMMVRKSSNQTGRTFTNRQYETARIAFTESPKISWNKGKKGLQKHSEEVRKKIGEYNKIRVMSEETRRKISESNKGRVVSPEGRKRMSEAKKKFFACCDKTPEETPKEL